MPFPMEWRLPDIKFLWSSGHFMWFPAKECLVSWAKIPCGGERIKNKEFCVDLEIPLNFHRECFSEIGPSTLPLNPWGMVLLNMHFLCSSGHFMQFLGENFILTSTPHPWQWRHGTVEHGCSVQICTFHSIPSQNFCFKVASKPNFQ